MRLIDKSQGQEASATSRKARTNPAAWDVMRKTWWEPDAGDVFTPLRMRSSRCIEICPGGDLFAPENSERKIYEVLAVVALASHHRFVIRTIHLPRAKDLLCRRRLWQANGQEHRSDAASEIIDGAKRLFAGVCESDVSEGPPPKSALPNAVIEQLESTIRKALPIEHLAISAVISDPSFFMPNIPDLMSIPGANHWLTFSPAKGSVNLRALINEDVLLQVDRVEAGASEVYLGGGSPFLIEPNLQVTEDIDAQCCEAGIDFVRVSLTATRPYNGPRRNEARKDEARRNDIRQAGQQIGTVADDAFNTKGKNDIAPTPSIISSTTLSTHSGPALNSEIKAVHSRFQKRYRREHPEPTLTNVPDVGGESGREVSKEARGQDGEAASSSMRNIDRAAMYGPEINDII